MSARWMLLICGMYILSGGPPCTADSATCQLVELTPVPTRRAQFGQSVAAAGNHVLVGDPGDVGDDYWGAAHIYLRRGAMFDSVETLRAFDQILPAGIGDAVALNPDGDVAVVGAPFDVIDERIDGSVYVFEHHVNRGWYQSDKLTSDQPDSNPSRNEYFGKCVATDGRSIIVGAYGDGPDGAAYVFERDESRNWTQTARLTPGDPLAWYFGFSVAIDGDTAVVGAPNDFQQGDYAGSAYVFERTSSGLWRQTQKLVPELGPLQGLGWSVAVGGNSILVGVPGDNFSKDNAGSAYAYVRNSDSMWIEMQRMYPPEHAIAGSFGASITIDQNLAIICDENYSGPMFGFGAAFVYSRELDETWQLVATVLAADPQDGSRFGRAVALSGNAVVVGAPFQDENGVEDVGAAYVFAVGPDSDNNGVMDACECRAAGDLTLDGAIDFQDLILVLSSFALDAGGDLDADGDTDLQDLATLLANFGRNCP